MAETDKNINVSISRRKLLIGSGAAAVLGLGYMLGSRNAESAPQGDPKEIAKAYIEDFIGGNSDRVFRHLPPDMQASLEISSDRHIWVTNIIGWARGDCKSSSKIKEVLIRDSGEIKMATVLFDKPCSIFPFGLVGEPKLIHSASVPLQKVNNKYYPVGLPRI